MGLLWNKSAHRPHRAGHVLAHFDDTLSLLAAGELDSGAARRPAPAPGAGPEAYAAYDAARR